MNKITTFIFFCIISCYVIPSNTYANLWTTNVQPNSEIFDELNLSIHIINKKTHWKNQGYKFEPKDKDNLIVTIKAPTEKKLEHLFGASLYIGDKYGLNPTLVIPLEIKNYYNKKNELKIIFTISEPLLKNAYLNLRTGSALSERVYKISLAEFLDGEKQN